jgi:hypothetical protein
MAMWKQEILDNNEHLVVPRAVFMLRKKLKGGLRAHLNYMTHIFECASDKTDNDDDFQTTFVDCEYQSENTLITQ